MGKNEREESVEIDIKRLLLVLWQRLWMILLVAVLGGAFTFGYAWFFIAPTYSASAQLYVNNNYVDSPGFSSSQLVAAQDLANTYMVIMESRTVLDDVAQKTKLGYTYEQLTGMVSAAAVNETEIFEVRVTGTNYQHVAQIANAVVEVLPDKITAVVEGSSVRVVDYAVENPVPVGPNYRSYLLMGVLSGVLLSGMVVVALELLDTTIRSEEYLTQKYSNIPLLTVISSDANAKNGYYRGYYEQSHKKGSSSRTGGVKR